MGTSKLMEKLNDFFDLSENKQKKKHEKLLKIIHKLEDKKARIEQEVKRESEIDETSSKFHDLSDELKVISKLIKKAKKHNVSE